MLDRIRHLEIIREAATKHEDRHEQRDVQGEDEALVAQPLLEPAFGRCTVPHLLHVTHIGEVGIQVVLLRVCKCHIHVHMHVHVHVHIRMCVAQLQQAGSVRSQARDVTFPAPSASIGVEFIAGYVGSKTWYTPRRGAWVC